MLELLRNFLFDRRHAKDAVTIPAMERRGRVTKKEATRRLDCAMDRMIHTLASIDKKEGNKNG